MNPNIHIKTPFLILITFLFSCKLFSQIDTTFFRKMFQIEYALDSGDINYFHEMGLDPDSCSYPPLYHEMCNWIGTSYKYAGTGKEGIDCSGLVKKIIDRIYNLQLTGGSSNIFSTIIPIEKDCLQEGDLVFFKIAKNRISHVGIYLSNNKFIHASVKLGVIISDLNEPYYKKYFHSGGRLP